MTRPTLNSPFRKRPSFRPELWQGMGIALFIHIALFVVIDIKTLPDLDRLPILDPIAVEVVLNNSPLKFDAASDPSFLSYKNQGPRLSEKMGRFNLLSDQENFTLEKPKINEPDFSLLDKMDYQRSLR